MQHGRDLHELLAEELLKGNISWPFEGLAPQTDYVAYAFGLTSECEVTSALSKAEFTTLSSRPVSCGFDLFATDVTTTSLTLNVVPTDDSVPYYFDLMTAEQYATFCNASPDDVPAFVSDVYFPSLADEYGLTVSEVVQDIASRGPDSYAFSGLKAATTYYAFAVGVAADGSTTTAAVVADLRTSGDSDNAFTVTVTDRGADWADIHVRPQNSDPYILVPELQEYFEGMSDDEIIADVLRAYESVLRERTYYGEAQLRETNLIPDRDYYVLVFGYDAGVPTTPLTRRAFRTNQSVPVSCTFDLTVKDVDKTTARAIVAPSDEGVSYFCHYIPAAEYEAGGGNDASVRAYTDRVVDELTRLNEGWPRWEVLQAILYRGGVTITLEEGSLLPDTEYYFYAIGMTADGTFTTVPVLSERFTTLSAYETRAGIEIKYMMMDGAGFGRPDDAVLYGWFYPSHAEKWYGAGFVDDDAVREWTDQEVVDYLLEHGTTGYGSGSIWHYVPWGSHVNYIAIAEDAEGYHSPVARLSVTADRASLSAARLSDLGGSAPAHGVAPRDLGAFAFSASGKRAEAFRSMRELPVRPDQAVTGTKLHPAR